MNILFLFGGSVGVYSILYIDSLAGGIGDSLEPSVCDVGSRSAVPCFPLSIV